MKEKFDYKYGEDWYTVQGAETFARENLKAMKAEYSRMRDIAQKRVSRLAEKFPEVAGAKRMYDTGKLDKSGNPIMARGFQKLSNLDVRDLPKAFSELAKFVKASGSSVIGQRQKMSRTMSTLNKAIGAGEGGQVGVTKQNYWRVIKILEETRKRKLTYGSDKIVTLAESTMALSQDQFDSLMDNLDSALEHADEFSGSLEEYMEENNIHRYQMVDMDDFIADIGW